MKLNELEPAKAIEGEICGAGDDDFTEDSELEEDLQEALNLLTDCLLYMERVVVRPRDGRVRSYPKHLPALMEEVSNFLDAWDLPERDKEEE